MWKQCLLTLIKLRTVNQGLCGQNLGQCVCLIFIIHGAVDRTVSDGELDTQIKAAANKLRDGFVQ